MKNQNSDSLKIEAIQDGLGFNQHPDVLPPIFYMILKIKLILSI